jgi:hypothetical protein
LRVVVAEDDAVEDNVPDGTGEPVEQAHEFALTEPPEPVPVE